MSGNYEVFQAGGLVKAWTRGVPFDDNARRACEEVSRLPFIHSHIAVMPDVHHGIGATVGSVVPTKGAIIPAAVGVDIGCGMVAAKTSLTAEDLPDSLRQIRDDIENVVPVGFAGHDRPAKIPQLDVFELMLAKHPRLEKMSKQHPMMKAAVQMGTLGGGNHFIELCLDENNDVWVMLHSGSRGIGNIIGRYFINVAKDDMRIHHVNLPDKDLSYLSEGTERFDDYVEAVGWAQNYARLNREVMMSLLWNDVLLKHFPDVRFTKAAINCHHNYVQKENHFGSNVWITRKGAVSARYGELGIIPGSMGERSFIVNGLGNPDSFHSCSHGAGRVMSRTQAKRELTLEDHAESTAGVECRKDEGVLDESPKAYKDIDAVMAAQSDLVEVVHTLKQVLCVKG